MTHDDDIYGTWKHNPATTVAGSCRLRNVIVTSSSRH
jgi:hypothetical protein